MKSACCERTLDLFLHYETLKIVDIKNRKVGLLFRLIQAVILTYVIGYVIIYKKGYQEHDTVISTVSTKLKGSDYVDFKNYSNLFNGIQIFDPTDYVIPPQETDAFFVTTNMVITPNQTQGKCAEDIKFKHNWCNNDNDCLPALKMVKQGNGVRTGKCVRWPAKPSTKVCEIYGWCPTEVDSLPMPVQGFSDKVALLDFAKDFTVLIKNQINFPKFKVQRQNIIGYKSRNAFKKCIYHKDENKQCPIFRLKDILKYAGENFTEMAFKGGVIGINIDWDCNLDLSIEDCNPVYSFQRLDDPDAPISPGYNFRYSSYFVENRQRYRTLTKAFGIKFQVLVHGRGGKFSPVPLFLNLGAGFALLGLAKIWCDFMVLYCLKKRKVYKQYKFDRIDDEAETDTGDETAMLAEEEAEEEQYGRMTSKHGRR